ncbi:unnamed protein product [Phytophthora fragariaefolia]|uniref:Unnamed protein product n=1 Tax=Phytophthora fragariaefolia TaxID=1490495 RepID=A0A9W7D4J8_9STRA|nr:unnamed protein product [Phytophthora fragariaefolia]
MVSNQLSATFAVAGSRNLLPQQLGLAQGQLELPSTRQDSRRPGPTPRLPKEAETSIFEWIISRQQVGHPPLSKFRNAVDYAVVDLLFHTLTKVMNDNMIDGSRVFNVDETAFQSRKKTKFVVAARGSSNVWSTEVTTAFHRSIVAFGSASGFVIPPMAILTSKTVGFTILDTD